MIELRRQSLSYSLTHQAWTHPTKIFCPEQLKTIVTSISIRPNSAASYWHYQTCADPLPFWTASESALDQQLSSITAAYTDSSACQFWHSEPKDIRLHPTQTTLTSIMSPVRIGWITLWLLSNCRIQAWTHTCPRWCERLLDLLPHLLRQEICRTSRTTHRPA